MSTGTIQVNGGPSIAIVSVEITMSRVGAWSAVGYADEPVAGSSAVLTIAGERFVGTVISVFTAQTPAARYGFRVVGGAGGLSTQLTAKYYKRATTALLLSDLASESGETLASGAALAHAALTWARPVGSAADALRDLTKRVTGAVWRVLADGTLWVGVDTWPDSGITADVLLEDDADGIVTLAQDAPTLRPGTALLGANVSAVVHCLSPNGLRTEAWLQRAEEGEHKDRIRWALETIVERTVRTTALRVYRCLVLKQNADLTLELRPDATSGLPDLGSVPIRHGLPGVDVEVNAGAYVHVIFADGDRAKPFAALWDTSPGLVRLTFDNGTKALARVDDNVHAGTVTGTVSGGNVIFTYTPHNGIPQTPSATLVLNGGHITSGAGWGRG